MNSALAELVAVEMEKNDRVLSLLGIKVLKVETGRAELTMKVTNDMVNGFGIAHGGITFTLADTAFAYACNSRNRLTVAASCEIKFLHMVHPGDSLIAIATERNYDGKVGTYDVTVTNQNNAEVATFVGQSRTLNEQVVPDLAI
jgi:acyl-CoA thioesterase